MLLVLQFITFVMLIFMTLHYLIDSSTSLGLQRRRWNLWITGLQVEEEKVFKHPYRGVVKHSRWAGTKPWLKCETKRVSCWEFPKKHRKCVTAKEARESQLPIGQRIHVLSRSPPRIFASRSKITKG